MRGKAAGCLLLHVDWAQLVSGLEPVSLSAGGAGRFEPAHWQAMKNTTELFIRGRPVCTIALSVCRGNTNLAAYPLYTHPRAAEISATYTLSTSAPL